MSENDEMPDVWRQLVDALVYAPVGLLATAKDKLPEFIEEGRRRVGPQMDSARQLGEIVVASAQREAERHKKEVTDFLTQSGLWHGTDTETETDTAAEPEGPSGRS